MNLDVLHACNKLIPSKLISVTALIEYIEHSLFGMMMDFTILVAYSQDSGYQFAFKSHQDPRKRLCYDRINWTEIGNAELMGDISVYGFRVPWLNHRYVSFKT